MTKEQSHTVTALEQQNLDTVNKLLQGFMTGNTDQVDDLVHDEFKNHNAPEGLRDKTGFKEIITMVHNTFESFDELNLKPAHLFAKGNMVAMMDVGTGKKDGKLYTHKDIHIFKMKDGKMIAHWNSFNLPCQRDLLMEFMNQSN